MFSLPTPNDCGVYVSWADGNMLFDVICLPMVAILMVVCRQRFLPPFFLASAVHHNFSSVKEKPRCKNADNCIHQTVGFHTATCCHRQWRQHIHIINHSRICLYIYRLCIYIYTFVCIYLYIEYLHFYPFVFIVILYRHTDLTTSNKMPGI